jgi:hypothetical protein
VTTTATNFRMPFGRHKGQPLSELGDSYIGWLRSLGDLREPLRSAVEEEHRKRIDWNTGSRYRWRRYNGNPDDDSDDEDQDSDRDRPPEKARELVECGFRSLAKVHHPDHGGSDQAMRLVIEARQWLLQQISALEIWRN